MGDLMFLIFLLLSYLSFKRSFIGNIGYLDTPAITIDPPVIAGLSKGDYLYREKVTGVDSDAVGYVVNWDNDTRILQVNNVSEGNMFIEGEKVVGIWVGLLFSVG